jgi:hypothetical protein
MLHRKLGEPAKAEDSYRTSVRLYERLTADHPGDPEHRDGLALACHRLAFLMNERPGRAQEALPFARRAIEVAEKLAADFPDAPRYRSGLVRASTTPARSWGRRASGRNRRRPCAGPWS